MELSSASGHVETNNRVNEDAAISDKTIMPGQAAEAIRLVIWDLDETFWSGTLSEGGIVPRENNISLIKSLSERGIVNSICSKNNLDEARSELERLGVWDYFIFPQIAFASKGPMIRKIVEATNLRPETILFLDDNPMNLNEALFLYPGMQVADPAALEIWNPDEFFAGKPDPEMDRLRRYKVLEQKNQDRQSAQGNNLDFLRQSSIRISFHYDVENEFTRIHDLVNRTNQLNFTKNRWPEDEAQALEMFRREASEQFLTVTGYIKVSDRYGHYGICGFFMIRQYVCRHFLFSCRTMSMGVEQFAWNRLMRPHIDIAPPVISTLNSDESAPDWITVVNDADSMEDENRPHVQEADRLTICLRGGCDFTSMEHYFRTGQNVIGEYSFAYKTWSITPWARTIAVAAGAHTPAGQALMKRIGFIPDNFLESAIHTLEADVYVLSFAVEYACALYRSRSTGLVFPFCNDYLTSHVFSEVPYETIVERAGGPPGFSADEWAFMQEEFEYVGHRDKQMFSADVSAIFEKLSGKTVIVLALNDRIGSSDWIKLCYGEINNIVLPLARTYGVHIVDFRDHVKSVDDLIDPEDYGVHFSREVYLKTADSILEICKNQKVMKMAR